MERRRGEVTIEATNESAPAAGAGIGEASRRAHRRLLLAFDCPSPQALRRLLEALPDDTGASIDELLVVNPTSPDFATTAEAELAARKGIELRFHQNPRTYDYGSARKAAFEYAISRDFDSLVCMRGDGSHPPEVVCDLIAESRSQPAALVIAARGGTSGKPRSVSHRWSDRFERGPGLRIHERMLRLGLRDYLSSFRVIPVRALRAVPFQLVSDERSFETELLIQLRAVGVPLREVHVDRDWSEWTGALDGLLGLLHSVIATIAYRLHQLHVTRHGQYLIDHGIHYTLKLSPTGSHMQIVEAIRPGSLVLDLGCSQGLLARPLLEKEARVTGVDADPPDGKAEELAAYYQRDLEQPGELPVGRAFDYVVVADVIEHLRNRSELLREARRYLKPGGRLIISTGNVAIWFYRLSLLAGRFEYGPRGILDSTHVHLYTRATFRREIERAGFHVLQERVTSLPFEVVFESTGRSRSVQRLARAYHLLARLWPEMFAYQFILEAEIETLDEQAAADPAAQ